MLNNSHFSVFCAQLTRYSVYLRQQLSIMQQFGASMFHMVVHWQKLGEVENQCNLHNTILAINGPKIIKVSKNLTKLWQKQFWLFFSETRCIAHSYYFDITKQWNWNSAPLLFSFALRPPGHLINPAMQTLLWEMLAFGQLAAQNEWKTRWCNKSVNDNKVTVWCRSPVPATLQISLQRLLHRRQLTHWTFCTQLITTNNNNNSSNSNYYYYY